MSDWKENFQGFAIQRHHEGWEGKALTIVACLDRLPCRTFVKPEEVPVGWVPCGTVPWVSAVLNRPVVPHYFPKFLSQYVSRRIWYADKWTKERAFVKPTDRHKRFTGFIAPGGWSKKRKGPLIYSEIVSFQDEWRFYVADGRLLTAEWYWPEGSEEKPAPVLNIQWPDGWCGTADFGTLPDGKVELIECHPPIACGWYGKEHKLYAEFLAKGWKYMLNGSYDKLL
jgi:hypothetical protein